MGATILGDGKVAMIVDVPALTRAASSSPVPVLTSAHTQARRPVVAQELQ